MPARSTAFAYGLIYYLTFFATFLYAIGFVKTPAGLYPLSDAGIHSSHCIRELIAEQPERVNRRHRASQSPSCICRLFSGLVL